MNKSLALLMLRLDRLLHGSMNRFIDVSLVRQWLGRNCTFAIKDTYHIDYSLAERQSFIETKQ